MDILGIGPLELLFIIIIALIVLGPKDMVKAGRTIGKYLRQVTTSSTWQAVQHTSRELRKLPTKLMRDAGLEEDLKEIGSIIPSTQDLIQNMSSDDNEGIKKSSEGKASVTESNGDISDWITPPSDIESPEPSQPTKDPQD